MKILHLNYSNFKGGASRAAYRIHESLIKKKIDSNLRVNIYNKYIFNKKVTGPKNSLFNFFYLIKSYIGSRFGKFFSKDKLSIQSLNIFPSFFYKKINKSNFDIVHFHWICGEMISVKDISKIKKPIVWTIHDMWPFCATEHFTFSNKWKYGYFKNKNLFNFQNFFFKKKIKYWKNNINVVGVSRWIKDCCSKSVVMKKFPSTIISNTLDTNFWRPIKKNLAKKYFDIPLNSIVMGSGALGSNNDFLKGKDLLQLALQNIKSNKNNLILLLFGDLNNDLELFKDIKVINVGKLNHDKEIKLFYNCLDIFLLPSRLESFGQTAAEANSCGIPVISFNTSGVKDIVIHRINGWLAKAFDVGSFAKGIDYFLNLKKKTYKKFSNNSRRLSINRFDYNIIAKKYINLYKSILNK